MEKIQLLALLTSLLVFGSAGYLVARRLKRPVRAWTMVIIIVATAVAGYTGISVMLISGFGFTIYLNWALSDFGLGMILNLLIRRNVPAVR
jgi:hypothetical protein